MRTTAQLSHPVVLVTGHLVARGTLHQGQTQGVGNYTFLLQLSRVNHLQVLDRKCQLTESTGNCTRLIWTYLQSTRYIAIVKTIKDTAKEQGFYIYATPETFLHSSQWLHKDTATAGETLALGSGTVHVAQHSQQQLRFQLGSNSALVCPKHDSCACSFEM